ncbi:AraC family ligand binding domain-containing protein [Paraburkholderia sp. BR13439]|uniref:AraC family transcriptional regulator n=1 Tax=Paraburkholderia TaxID=1822464 RepID=UPI0034CEF665
MKPPTSSRPNQAKFWYEPSFAGSELLRAAYRTHRFPPHAHDEFAFGVIERGAQAWLDGHGRRVIMPEGTICVINPGHLHEGRPATEGGWDYRMIYMPATGLTGLLREEIENFSGTLYFPATVINDPQTMALIREAHVCSESNDATQLEKTSRLATAVAQLVRRHGQMSHPIPRLATIPGAVKRAREYIDAHIAENPTLDIISQAAGMSPFHLLRAFKEAIGVAPHAYLVQRRVEMARHLLLKGHPLRQVAIAAGYYDQGHLSREFRRFFGVPPGVARQ